MQAEGNSDDKESFLPDLVQIGQMLDQGNIVLKEQLMIGLARLAAVLRTRTVHAQTGDAHLFDQPAYRFRLKPGSVMRAFRAIEMTVTGIHEHDVARPDMRSPRLQLFATYRFADGLALHVNHCAFTDRSFKGDAGDVSSVLPIVPGRFHVRARMTPDLKFGKDVPLTGRHLAAIVGDQFVDGTIFHVVGIFLLSGKEGMREFDESAVGQINVHVVQIE